MASLESGGTTENLDFGNINNPSGGFGDLPIEEQKLQRNNNSITISAESLAVERRDLEALKNSIPQVISDTVRKLKAQYAYRNYWIDGTPAKFDGIEVRWDEKTNNINMIKLHLTSEDGSKRDFPVQLNKSGRNYVIMSTEVQGEIDTLSYKKEAPPNKRKPKKASIPGMNGVGDVRLSPVNKIFEGISTKDEILEKYFPGVSREIKGLIVESVRSQDEGSGNIRMEFKIQGIREGIFLYKGTDGIIHVARDYNNHTQTIAGVERIFRYEPGKKEVIMEKSPRQKFLDEFGKSHGFTLAPNEIGKVLFQNKSIPIENAMMYRYCSEKGSKLTHPNPGDGGTLDLQLTFDSKGILQIQRKGSTSDNFLVYFVDGYFVGKSKKKGLISSNTSGTKLTDFEEDVRKELERELKNIKKEIGN